MNAVTLNPPAGRVMENRRVDDKRFDRLEAKLDGLAERLDTKFVLLGRLEERGVADNARLARLEEIANALETRVRRTETAIGKATILFTLAASAIMFAAKMLYDTITRNHV